MSRSRKRYARFFNACGSNTEYYRDRNRDTRNKNRQMLRNMLANMEIEKIADVIYHITNNINYEYNKWDEPTDGSFACKTFINSVYKYPHYPNKDYPNGHTKDDHLWRVKNWNKHKRK